MSVSDGNDATIFDECFLQFSVMLDSHPRNILKKLTDEINCEFRYIEHQRKKKRETLE